MQIVAERVAIGSAIAALEAEAHAVRAAALDVTTVAAAHLRVPVAVAVRRAWEAVAAAVVAGAEASAAAEAEVVVVEAAAVAVAVVADEGGKGIMKQRNLIVAFVWLAAFSVLASAQTTIATKAKSFKTAQEAADALVDAAEKYDETSLVQILGPDSYDIIHTGEPARDREVAQQFAAQARAKNHVAIQPGNSRRAFLNIGDDDWPFPVPLVKGPAGWSFDTRAGRLEILYRRIGGNELSAIQICRGYVEAQHEYALIKREGSVNQYAQRIISTPGAQDGLAWQNPDGTWGGPIGENVAKAIARGYTSRTEPFHGYFFRVLKGQGPAAPLGQLDFVVKGVMIGGFALVAFPAQYRVTGVQTFIVSHDGVVYQKDLGPKTAELASVMDRFNPDKTWTPVLDQ